MKTQSARYWWLALLAAWAVGGLLWWRGNRDAAEGERADGGERTNAYIEDVGGGHSTEAPAAEETSAEAEAPTDDEAETMTAEERAEAEETRLVDEFDALTDRWMEPAKGGVTMDDIDKFAARFRALPKARKDECLHRALNLIPDDNVMLLAGILMDKTQDKELLETVYSDVLNRDETVKKPILQQIFKDKTHPCWADTAWILDVTGELPKTK